MSKTAQAVLLIGLLVFMLYWLVTHPACRDGVLSLSASEILRLCR
jgi:hypothetical protein